MVSPHSSISAGDDDNSFASQPVLITRILDLNIKDQVPVILDLDSPTYTAWRSYFSLLFRSYRLRDHIDGTVDARAMKHDDDWSAIDATIVKWLFLTVSPGIFHMVTVDDPTAYIIWTRLCALFQDNELQRRVLLQGEFFILHQNDLSVDAYCMRLKVLADELREVGMTIDDSTMLTNLIRGLHPDLSQSASNLSLATPTFAKAVTYLRMEEKRLRHMAQRATHSALAAGTSAGPPAAPPAPRGPTPASYGPPATPSSDRGRQRKRGRDGRPRNTNTTPRPAAAPAAQPPPPWMMGFNPWTGVVHAYSMPVPRAPAPGILGSGPRPATHQALLAAPSYGAPPAYSYGAPPASPYGASPTPYGAPSAGTAPWDPTFIAALQAAPSPSTYNGDGDWYMDTGASSHMASHPGCSHPETSAPM